MVSFKEVEDVGVDDCIVIIADVAEEVTCFFVAQSSDVVDKPGTSFLRWSGVDDG